MPMVLGVLYLTLCLLCGLMGRQTAFGFLGHFLLSLIITPIGDFLIQVIARPSREIRRKLADADDA